MAAGGVQAPVPYGVDEQSSSTLVRVGQVPVQFNGVATGIELDMDPDGELEPDG